MPRCLMYGELWQGRRYQGHPKLRYKDTVKSNIQWCHVKPKELEESAANSQSGGPKSTSPLQTLKVQETKRLLQPERNVTKLLRQL